MSSRWDRMLAQLDSVMSSQKECDEVPTSLRVRSEAQYAHSHRFKLRLLHYLDRKHQSHISRKTFLSLDSSIKFLQVFQNEMQTEIDEWAYKAITKPGLTDGEKADARRYYVQAEEAHKICEIAIETMRIMGFVVLEGVSLVKSIDQHPGAVSKRFQDVFKSVSEIYRRRLKHQDDL